MKLSIKQTIALDYLEDDTTKEVGYGGGAWCLQIYIQNRFKKLLSVTNITIQIIR